MNTPSRVRTLRHSVSSCLVAASVLLLVGGQALAQPTTQSSDAQPTSQPTSQATDEQPTSQPTDEQSMSECPLHRGEQPGGAQGEQHGGAHGEGHGGPDFRHMDTMHHDFSDAEQWSAVFDAADRDGWQRPVVLVNTMGVNDGMTVADLGAGTGYFLPYLSLAVGTSGHVLALDVEESLIQHMGERATREGLANVDAVLVPYDSPEFEPASVDRVLIVNTWHHISERGAYAGLLRDGLTPGGAVYIVDFTLETEMGPPRENRLSPEQVIEELAAGGLVAAEVTDHGLPEQYVVVGVRLAE